MNVLITCLNSKFIHAALAPWYLKAACDSKGYNANVCEYTINDSLDYVLGELYRKRPNIAAFSCYIWNISETLWLCENLKKVLTDVKIVLGGPEVSYDAEDLLQAHSYIDYILKGEGERTLPWLLACVRDKVRPYWIEGLSYRWDGKLYKNKGFGIIEDLNEIPTVYTDEMLERTKGKIVYVETTRGCPFCCSYCLSSTTKGVRYFKMDRVKDELMKLATSGVRQIKFVDRTFNANKARALEILTFICGNLADYNINFHFEVAADLFDHELLAIAKQLPRGLVQFEIGVQTTNEEVLKNIDRITDIEKVKRNIKLLVKFGNIHVHADLIAGLPKEDLSSFKNSFNDVYDMGPHQLQLGFLKLLKGSKVRSERQKHAYIFKEDAPYEVLENDTLTYMDVLLLKDIEEVLERFYNSGRFVSTLNYSIRSCALTPYDFYEKLSVYFRRNGLFARGISGRELYDIFYEYLINSLGFDKDIIKDLLAFDFLSCDNTGNIPRSIKKEIDKSFRDKCHTYLKNFENINDLLPEFSGQNVKEIIKKVYFYKFRYILNKENQLEENKILIFNYNSKDKVSSLYESVEAIDFENLFNI